ncbi:MAG TPA: hypothetical protein VLE53_18950 [Gemmatimonadaceae bacterium]|nr:hypothetical protein [Gemmatimonadaceae bacterium]
MSGLAIAPKAWSKTMLSTGTDSTALAVFVGTTPCGPIANEFTGFPAQTCEKIKWQLTLFRDAQTGRPNTFLYEGTRTSRRGTWSVQRGTPFHPEAQVYRLMPTPSGPALSLLSVDDSVLLLLDEELRVLVGDAGGSYALNRLWCKCPAFWGADRRRPPQEREENAGALLFGSG